MNGIIACAQGTLGRDAELRYTQSGLAVLNFNIAVQDAKKGEAETEWLKCTVWGEQAEALNGAGSLGKGAEVYVEGRMKLNTWQGLDGQQRAGLELSAWRVDVLGAIGRRAKKPAPLLESGRPQRPPTERTPVGARLGPHPVTDDGEPF